MRLRQQAVVRRALAHAAPLAGHEARGLAAARGARLQDAVRAAGEVQRLVVAAVHGQLRAHVAEHGVELALLVHALDASLHVEEVVHALDHVAHRIAPAVRSAGLLRYALRQVVVVQGARPQRAGVRLDVYAVVHVRNVRLVDSVGGLDVQPDGPRRVHHDEAHDQTVLVHGVHEQLLEVVGHGQVRVHDRPLVVARELGLLDADSPPTDVCRVLVDDLQEELQGGLVVPRVQHPLVVIEHPVSTVVQQPRALHLALPQAAQAVAHAERPGGVLELGL